MFSLDKRIASKPKKTSALFVRAAIRRTADATKEPSKTEKVKPILVRVYFLHEWQGNQTRKDIHSSRGIWGLGLVIAVVSHIGLQGFEAVGPVATRRRSELLPNSTIVASEI